MPALDEADVLAEYSAFEVLPEEKMDFIYGHLLTSYINRQWFKQDIVYVIAGETPRSFDIENFGVKEDVWKTTHADEGYFHIVSITPGANVISCAGEWNYAEDYVKAHPDAKLMFSCAYETLASDYQESFLNNPGYASMKNILTNPNSVLLVASGNVKTILYALEESVPDMELGQYTSASVSSKLNNKITVCGYDPTKQNIFGLDEDSRRPIGFGRDKTNIVFPFMQLFKINGTEMTDTKSSFCTATASSALGNYLSILLYNNPGWTLTDAMTKMLDKYLYEENFKYLNKDGNIVNGEKWNLFRINSFLEEQVLCKEDFEKIQLSGDAVQLPLRKGLIYTGRGCQFEFDGVYYDTVKGNEQRFAAALAAGGGVVAQRWSRERWQKMGGGEVSLEAHLLNTSCESIPDLQLRRTIQVQ